MQQTCLYTVTVFTDDQVGLLNQVSIVFTRRRQNIESLSASPTSIPGVSKFTFTCWSTLRMMEQVVKQIEKRVGVLKAFLHTDDDIVYQNIALYKVPTRSLVDNHVVEKILRRHNARILEITEAYTVIEKTGHNDETRALFEELMQYGLTQYVRSGRVAVTKDAAEHFTAFLEEQRRLEQSQADAANSNDN